MPQDFTYIWNLRNNVNVQIKLKQTYRYRKQAMVARVEGGEGLVKKGKGIKKY